MCVGPVARRTPCDQHVKFYPKMLRKSSEISHVGNHVMESMNFSGLLVGVSKKQV